MTRVFWVKYLLWWDFRAAVFQSATSYHLPVDIITQLCRKLKTNGLLPIAFLHFQFLWHGVRETPSEDVGQSSLYMETFVLTPSQNYFWINSKLNVIT